MEISFVKQLVQAAFSLKTAQVNTALTTHFAHTLLLIILSSAKTALLLGSII